MSYVCHSDHHLTMLNATAHLAIAIQNLPNFEFSWSDSEPQQSRTSLSVNDFLPSESDGILQERATAYLEFLVTQFWAEKAVTTNTTGSSSTEVTCSTHEVAV